jgi:class 3 adenylate cyclase
MSAGAEIIALFLTDVEASNTLWQTHGNKMSSVLDHLDGICDRVIAAHGGHFDRERGEGDSHIIVFKEASSATRAAAELQRKVAAAEWPHGIQPRLRIGLHVGEAQRRGQEYTGDAIKRGERLRAVAHGGQVVASRALVELVGGELHDGLSWTSLGTHRVRDLPGWIEIFQLAASYLPREYPPLLTLDSGLPPVSSIVFLDAIGTTLTVSKLSHEDETRLLHMFSELFSVSYASARGQYLQFLGDGCLAIFGDPQAAMRFIRDARSAAASLDFELRAALHIGRVEFAFGAPYGRSLRIASALLKHAAPGKVTLTPAAAAVVEQAGDLVVRAPQT